MVLVISLNMDKGIAFVKGRILSGWVPVLLQIFVSLVHKTHRPVVVLIGKVIRFGLLSVVVVYLSHVL